MRVRARAGAVALGALCAGTALTACSSGSGSAGTTTTGARRTTTTTTTTAPVTTTSPPPATTTTTAGSASTCQPGQLTMTPGPPNGAAGTIGLAIAMVNAGAPCTMDGYPGMLLLGPSGAALPTNVVRGGSFDSAAANAPAALVSLAHGATASFVLTYEDVPVGNETSCPTSADAEITPPNAFAHNVIALQIAPCGGGTIHVSPVYLGT